MSEIQQIALRRLFNIPRDVAYFNCASMGPLANSVRKTGIETINRFATPWTLASEDWFSGSEVLRGSIARLLGADADAIALVPSVSYGVALAATNVPINRNENILVLREQFPSNYYSWESAARNAGAYVQTVDKVGDESWADAIEKSIDENTSVVAVPVCHWTDGELVDLVRIRSITNTVGTRLIVDASQALGAYPLDVNDFKPDFLMAVGYKWLLGPYGLSYLYVDEKWHDRGKPLEQSWLTRANSEDFSGLVEYTNEFRQGARRFDGGQYLQFILTPMATVAIQTIAEIGLERVYRTIRRMNESILESLIEVGFDFVSGDNPAGHILGIKIPAEQSGKVILSLKRRNVYLGKRGNTLRIAPHVYNDEADCDSLIDGLTESRRD